MNLAIVGSALAGGAVQIVDILLAEGLATDIRIYDDSHEAQDKTVLGVPVVGPIERLSHDFFDKTVTAAVIAVGSITPRQQLYERVAALSIPFPNIISSLAVVSASASMGKGNVILPLVYLGPRVKLGDNNYLTTASIVNHDSIIGSHCYFSTSVNVAGRVRIGDRVRLDASASITADAWLPDDSLVGPSQYFGPIRDR